MAEVVKLPKWGLTMEEATIVEWMHEIGERVEQGEVLAIVESEKAEVELPSPASGFVARYLVEEGGTILVGAEICVIAADEAELERSKEGG
ncbi:MAG: biotin/lipoyl-containing protein [Solirubrobacterales bacterium]